MKSDRAALLFGLLLLSAISAYTFGACSDDGDDGTGGGGGGGITALTRFLGDLAPASNPRSGVNVCIAGTDPISCDATDANGVFSVADDVVGRVVLTFQNTAALCLDNVVRGSIVTLDDVLCAGAICTPASVQVQPPQATAIAICNAEGDSDGDGVPDSRDLCPGTPAGSIVNSDGCTIDQLAPCAGPWKNHGEYVAAVADATRIFLREGLITSQQRDDLVSAAADSDCGRGGGPEPTPTATPSATPTPGGNDSDGDGVADASDQCPGTAAGSPVDANGCSIDQLAPCGGTWRNHGDYVSTVADVSRNFVLAGIITHDERSAIVQAAAQSDCGR